MIIIGTETIWTTNISHIQLKNIEIWKELIDSIPYYSCNFEYTYGCLERVEENSESFFVNILHTM